MRYAETEPLDQTQELLNQIDLTTQAEGMGKNTHIWVLQIGDRYFKYSAEHFWAFRTHYRLTLKRYHENIHVVQAMVMFGPSQDQIEVLVNERKFHLIHHVLLVSHPPAPTLVQSIAQFLGYY